MEKYKIPSKAKKWTDTMVPEMKKFLGLIVLMGQIKKDVSTTIDPLIGV